MSIQKKKGGVIVSNRIRSNKDDKTETIDLYGNHRNVSRKHTDDCKS